MPRISTLCFFNNRRPAPYRSVEHFGRAKACARTCASGAYTRCNLRPLPRARPTPPTGCAARRTGAQPAHAHSGQPAMGHGDYMSAAGQRRLALPVRFSITCQQASGRLAARRPHHSSRPSKPPLCCISPAPPPFSASKCPDSNSCSA
jgi:hypothetical protein